ncbi:hypothetical protein [Amycolatopsis sp. cmx-4-54]|uniref:hypothetical protein n=1 Tax=Amycolatopsis sp. cmx-4-54 TaxID=2790936 RepID=UPI00397901C2
MTHHNAHKPTNSVWVIYYLPDKPKFPVPSVIWTLPDAAPSGEPCRWCARLDRKGPCPGAQEHTREHYARLTVRPSLNGLQFGLFELPPHISVWMCGTHLYAQLVRHINQNRPTGNDEQDASA